MRILLLTIILLHILSLSESYVLQKQCELNDYHITAYFEDTPCLEQDSYFTCIDGNPYQILCNEEDGPETIALPSECNPDSFDYFECADNLDEYPSNVYLQKHVYSNDFVYKIELYKPFECINTIVYVIAEDKVYRAVHYDVACSTIIAVRNFTINTMEIDGSEVFKFEYTSNVMLYKYIQTIEDSQDRKRYYRTNMCFNSVKFFAYKDNNNFKIQFEDIDCTMYPVPLSIDDFPFFEGTDYLEQGKGLCYVNQYENYDECMEDNEPPMIDVLNCNERICFDGLSVLHEMSYNETHYKVNVSQSNGEEECDLATLSDTISYAKPYKECLLIINGFGGEIPIKLEKNKLLSFDDVDCEGERCISNGIVNITENLIVDFNLTLSDSSLIFIPINIRGNQNKIIVKNDGIINIKGGTVVIPIRTDEEHQYLYQQIEKDGRYKYTIIKGKYNGSFDDILLEKSSNLKIDRCETLDPKFENDYDELSVVFKFDKSNCSLKWWVILLICLGILAVIVAISIIVYVHVNKRKYKGMSITKP